MNEHIGQIMLKMKQNDKKKKRGRNNIFFFLKLKGKKEIFLVMCREKNSHYSKYLM
jgi:hypothetical protein